MSATVPAAAAPLRAVRAAIEDGSGTLRQIADVTGLPADVVAAAIDHLVRAGSLTASTLSIGCPEGGCGGCASGAGTSPGCGAAAPSSARRGPVLIALSPRRT